MRSDHHAGRTWGKRGETPIVETTGARHGMSAESGATRTPIPAQGGQHSGDYGQQVIAA
jgi:hypothetical protein